MRLFIENFISFLRISPRYFLLQIEPTGIYCALVSIKKNMLLLHTTKHIACLEHEITITSIANPTKLQTITRSFLDQHHQGPLPIICFSSLFNAMVCPPQHALQHLLCLSKISGPVIGLHNGALLNADNANSSSIPFIQSEAANFIDLVSTASVRNWQKRLYICIFMMAVPLAGTIGYGYYQSHLLKTILLQEKQLNNYLNKLKPVVQAVKKLEVDNNLLSDRINTIKNLTEEQEVPAHICQTIATHIPPNTWITDMSIGPKPGNDNNSKQAAKHIAETLLKNTPIKTIGLHILGKTTEPDEVSLFLEALTTALPNSTISIEHITRTRQEKHQPQSNSTRPYSFSLAGLFHCVE